MADGTNGCLWCLLAPECMLGSSLPEYRKDLLHTSESCWPASSSPFLPYPKPPQLTGFPPQLLSLTPLLFPLCSFMLSLPPPTHTLSFSPLFICSAPAMFSLLAPASALDFPDASGCSLSRIYSKALLTHTMGLSCLQFRQRPNICPFFSPGSIDYWAFLSFSLFFFCNYFFY